MSHRISPVSSTTSLTSISDNEENEEAFSPLSSSRLFPSSLEARKTTTHPNVEFVFATQLSELFPNNINVENCHSLVENSDSVAGSSMSGSYALEYSADTRVFSEDSSLETSTLECSSENGAVRTTKITSIHARNNNDTATTNNKSNDVDIFANFIICGDLVGLINSCCYQPARSSSAVGGERRNNSSSRSSCQQLVGCGDENTVFTDDSDQFSSLLRRKVGPKQRTSTDLVNEIKTDVIDTVQVLAREGSIVVKMLLVDSSEEGR
jgi:hypothetical protein